MLACEQLLLSEGNDRGKQAGGISLTRHIKSLGVLAVSLALLLTFAGNSSSQVSTVICGGINNIATKDFATVCGGRGNQATGTAATIVGGIENIASGERSFIGGGFQNMGKGTGSVIPGGRINNAEGDWSFAAGRRAKARHEGAFVWSDSTFLDFPSTAKDESDL